jgi:hypothetical protein
MNDTERSVLHRFPARPTGSQSAVRSVDTGADPRTSVPKRPATAPESDPQSRGRVSRSVRIGRGRSLLTVEGRNRSVSPTSEGVPCCTGHCRPVLVRYRRSIVMSAIGSLPTELDCREVKNGFARTSRPMRASGVHSGTPRLDHWPRQRSRGTVAGASAAEKPYVRTRPLVLSPLLGPIRRVGTQVSYADVTQDNPGDNKDPPRATSRRCRTDCHREPTTGRLPIRPARRPGPPVPHCVVASTSHFSPVAPSLRVCPGGR